jgi:hypothetical protein
MPVCDIFDSLYLAFPGRNPRPGIGLAGYTSTALTLPPGCPGCFGDGRDLAIADHTNRRSRGLDLPRSARTRKCGNVPP